jgi:hypothetical protein
MGVACLKNDIFTTVGRFSYTISRGIGTLISTEEEVNSRSSLQLLFPELLLLLLSLFSAGSCISSMKSSEMSYTLDAINLFSSSGSTELIRVLLVDEQGVTSLHSSLLS